MSANILLPSGWRPPVGYANGIAATGRIVFSFAPESHGTSTIPNVPLENGDIFLVPSVPSTVNAVGATMTPASGSLLNRGTIEALAGSGGRRQIEGSLSN